MRPGYVMSSVWNWLDSGPLYWRKTSMQLQRRGAKMGRGSVPVCLRLEVVHSMRDSVGWRTWSLELNSGL